MRPAGLIRRWANTCLRANALTLTKLSAISLAITRCKSACLRLICCAATVCHCVPAWGAAAAANLRADGSELPVTSGSIDLVLLPHVLEFSTNPHQILREVERALVPDGHLVVTCFNPMSLWGVRHSLGKCDAYPWQGRFIHLLRLKDWLALLGFEMAGGAMGCYVPPFTSQKWIDRFKFMDAAGDRWWPISGAVTFLHAASKECVACASSRRAGSNPRAASSWPPCHKSRKTNSPRVAQGPPRNNERHR